MKFPQARATTAFTIFLCKKILHQPFKSYAKHNILVMQRAGWSTLCRQNSKCSETIDAHGHGDKKTHGFCTSTFVPLYPEHRRDVRSAAVLPGCTDMCIQRHRQFSCPPASRTHLWSTVDFQSYKARKRGETCR